MKTVITMKARAKVLFLLTAVLAIANGCEEKTLTGELSLSFYKGPSDVTVLIRPIENIDIPILTDLKPDSRGTYPWS